MNPIEKSELKLVRHILVLCGTALSRTCRADDIDEQTQFCIDRAMPELDRVRRCLEDEIRRREDES